MAIKSLLDRHLRDLVGICLAVRTMRRSRLLFTVCSGAAGWASGGFCAATRLADQAWIRFHPPP